MNKQNLEHNTHHTEPANEAIAALAYSFFEATGRLDGHDLEHWLRAKEQLVKSRSHENESQKGVKPEGPLARDNAKKNVSLISNGKRSLAKLLNKKHSSPLKLSTALLTVLCFRGLQSSA
ncbi:MAG: DUF2934 domain-containing protein [Limisphaerales bacterium]